MMITADQIDARAVAGISEHLITGYSFFTKDGLRTIWPDHPQYTEAEKAYERHMQRLARAWFKSKRKRRSHADKR